MDQENMALMKLVMEKKYPSGFAFSSSKFSIINLVSISCQYYRSSYLLKTELSRKTNYSFTFEQWNYWSDWSRAKQTSWMHSETAASELAACSIKQSFFSSMIIYNSETFMIIPLLFFISLDNSETLINCSSISSYRKSI